MRSKNISVHILCYAMVAFAVAIYAMEVAQGGNEWKTGDWLINYSGGFVRRGLIGQIIYLLAVVGDFNILWVAFGLQVCVYFILAFCILRIYSTREKEYSWNILIFSPAFLFVFWVYDVQGGFRKEILVFLSYALLVVGVLEGKIWCRIAAILLFFVASLSHEMAILCLPFFLWTIIRFDQSASRAFFLFVYSAGSVLCLFLVVAFPGDSAVANGICESVVSLNVDRSICMGAINALRYDTRFYVEKVAYLIPWYQKIYSVNFIVAMIPLLIIGIWHKNWIILVAGIIALSPLFVVAADWGRWLAIFFFFTTMICFVEHALDPMVRVRRIPMFLVLLYPLLWGIDHCCRYEFNYGALGLLQRLLQGA